MTSGKARSVINGSLLWVCKTTTIKVGDQQSCSDIKDYLVTTADNQDSKLAISVIVKKYCDSCVSWGIAITKKHNGFFAKLWSSLEKKLDTHNYGFFIVTKFYRLNFLLRPHEVCFARFSGSSQKRSYKLMWIVAATTQLNVCNDIPQNFIRT